MLAEALQKLVDLAKTEIYDYGDRSLSSRPLHNIPLPEEPIYPTVDLISLSGFAQFVGKNKQSGTFIRCKAQSVECLTEEFGKRRQRNVLARVTCNVKPFNFGTFVDMEHFRIELLTRFVSTPDLENILEFTSKLTSESANSLVDNGIAQTITAKIGIATNGPATVPSPCRLAPVRSFREIEQPEGVFVLRLRKGQTGGVDAALFEHFTDWERAASLLVADFLRENFDDLSDVPVYA